ncbi:MAG TPA: hypothetical protein VL360_06550 [Gammaproteobacteria bacterium]|nr:hypothetical protein [Gammaproteobacteria bacterium]
MLYSSIQKLYFSQDKALIFKRHKSAPYEETKEEQVFYPGGNENRGSVFRIANNINIAAEICREHYLGMVSWRHIDEDILIHFVLSDSVLLRPEHFQGKYVIQLDSHHKPRLFVTNEEQFKHINVELYRVNGLESDNKLTGPYEESKIFVIRVVDEIDKMLRLTGNEEKKRLLQGIRREVMKRSQGVYSINLHEYLEKQFTDKESVGIILQKEFSMFSVLSAQSTEQGLTDSIKIILRLLYEEKIKNPQHHEHTSRDETAGLKKT